jgi:hypothetical protein
MLKIFFADQGSKADVLAALGHIREWAGGARPRTWRPRVPTSPATARSRSALPWSP